VQHSVSPLESILLLWAEDMKCPSECRFAYYEHPLVPDEKDKYMYHKLCTISVIQAGILTEADIVGDDAFDED